MGAPTPETISPSKIAEVKAFMKAKEAVDELKALFPVAFRKLADLAGLYNATLDAAAAATKKRGVSSGPFELYSYSRKFDGEALYAAVGRQRFPSMGGVISAPEKHEIDKDRFVALVEAKTVSAEIADSVLTYTPSFHKPEPLSVP